MFTIILAITAFIVAGCAAYFSVQGLAALYAGSYLAVCIMAGSLEIGKLVAASYLKRHWKETNFILKFYLILAVVTLMGITSLGIFGFLTSAYQKSYSEFEIVSTKKEILISKKDNVALEISSIKNRLDTLNGIRVTQEKRVQDAGNYKVPREQAYEAINKANLEIEKLQNKSDSLNEELKNYDIEIIGLKTEENKSKDIGTLKFVSNLFSVPIETVIKWFTILIVLVFDPLALALILAYNNIVTKPKKVNETVEDKKDIPEEKKVKKIFNPFLKVKYKDK
jgi:hypothetical protein